MNILIRLANIINIFHSNRNVNYKNEYSFQKVRIELNWNNAAYVWNVIMVKGSLNILSRKAWNLTGTTLLIVMQLWHIMRFSAILNNWKCSLQFSGLDWIQDYMLCSNSTTTRSFTFVNTTITKHANNQFHT